MTCLEAFLELHGVHHTHATEITELMVEVTQMFLHIYIAKMTQNTAHKMKQVEIQLLVTWIVFAAKCRIQGSIQLQLGIQVDTNWYMIESHSDQCNVTQKGLIHALQFMYEVGFDHAFSVKYVLQQYGTLCAYLAHQFYPNSTPIFFCVAIYHIAGKFGGEFNLAVW